MPEYIYNTYYMYYMNYIILYLYSVWSNRQFPQLTIMQVSMGDHETFLNMIQVKVICPLSNGTQNSRLPRI